LTVVLNGGLASLAQAREHLDRGLDGAMLGRAAYHEPVLLGAADRMLFDPEAPVVTPQDAVIAYRPYVQAQLAQGTHLYAIVRHMLGLFHGRPGARAWRRILTVEGTRPGAGIDVVDRALEAVTARIARSEPAAALVS
jgi:tRNA-dihydrouridine synthase A